MRIYYDAITMRKKYEREMKSSEIDITSWKIGAYVHEAIVSAFNRDAKYPTEPYSVTKDREERMTGKDHADNFREFLKHYKRPPVVSGGE